MQEIERANPDTLYRVFGAADWGNREKFTDELLKDLIEGSLRDLARQQRRRHRHPRRRLRVPGRQVRRRHPPQQGRRVLHAAQRRADDGRDPRSEGRRVDLRPRLRHRRHAARRHRPREAERRRPAHLLRQDLRPGEEPHDLLRRPDEPRPPRHRGLPDRPRGHPPQSRLHRWCRRPRHLRLRDRQSTVLAQGMGTRGLGERPLGPSAVRPAAGRATATTPSSST